MANETFSATQTTVLTSDVDNDGQIDPGGPGVGDTVTTTVTITNNSTNTDATGVTFSETLQGMTLVDQTGDDINVSPIAFDDGGYTAAGNVLFTATASVLGNDTEPLGPEGFALNAGTVIANAGPITTAQGGSVTLNANGTFTYVSAVGFEGIDTFTYTLRDTGLDGAVGGGDDLTSTAATVSITVGPSVWFIDNSFAVNGNGTQASPFNSIAAFNAAQGQPNGPDSGDFIYLRFGAGTYSEADGINLADGQTLIGNGDDLVVNLVTIEVGTAGLTPTIQVTGAGGEGVQLAQNNTLSGFNISSTNAAADGIEDGGGTVGTLTISNVSISGTGQAIDIDQGGTIAVTLDSVTSTGASEEGIQLAGVAGSFTATTVSLNGMTGDAVDLDGNSATVAINGGSIGNSNDPGGIGVDINDGSGNVTIAAAITKTTAGDIVEITEPRRRHHHAVRQSERDRRRRQRHRHQQQQQRHDQLYGRHSDSQHRGQHRRQSSPERRRRHQLQPDRRRQRPRHHHDVRHRIQSRHRRHDYGSGRGRHHQLGHRHRAQRHQRDDRRQ